MAVFNDLVLQTSYQRPANLIYSLSSSNNGFVLDSTGTFQGKTVVGVLFNNLSGGFASAGFASATLSAAGTTIKLRVHPIYNGQQAALYFNDRSSSIFTITTGAGTVNQSISAAAWTNSGPEERRLYNLGYI